MSSSKRKNTTEAQRIFALDIGTRSVIGIVGEVVEDRVKVLAIESAEHSKRAMKDGQIDDIQQVGQLARKVTDRLQKRLGCKLEKVCIAAAGRALQTEHGLFRMELTEEQNIDADLVSRLEAGAVSQAEEQMRAAGDGSRFFLVGYTVAQYRLDNYPLNSLVGHKGRVAEADVVATFLPSEVVESLYGAMNEAELQVVSLTLEPIAAMNAAIPAELRLLNLALVDIGAGTADIAICRDGSVVGYTMVTLAGDEVTEAVMRACLVDFNTAEQIKRSVVPDCEITYKDILGLENTVRYDEIIHIIAEPMQRMAKAVAGEIIEVNGAAPSAVFLSGGGCKLIGLRRCVAENLGMDERRVAIAGGNFAKTVFSEKETLENAELTTPLGIAVSAGLGLLNDSYRIMLNGAPAKLFRSGSVTVQDVLLMNGYTYRDIMGRSGRNLSVTLDNQRLVLRGEPSTPSTLTVNGNACGLTTLIQAGDKIEFIPAHSGADAVSTLGELVGQGFDGHALLNGVAAPYDTVLKNGDVVITLASGQPLPVAEPLAPVEEPASREDEVAADESAEPIAVDEPAETMASDEPVDEVEETEEFVQTTITVQKAQPQPAPVSTDTPKVVVSVPSAEPTVKISATTAPAPVVTVTPVSPAPVVEEKAPAEEVAVVEEAPAVEEKPVVDEVPVAAAPAAEETAKESPEDKNVMEIRLNDAPLRLPLRADGRPYRLMDLLEHSGINFQKLDRPVLMQVNGREVSFQQMISRGDEVVIRCV